MIFKFVSVAAVFVFLSFGSKVGVAQDWLVPNQAGERDYFESYEFEQLMLQLVRKVDIVQLALRLEPSARLSGEAARDLTLWALDQHMKGRTASDRILIRDRLLKLEKIRLSDFLKQGSEIVFLISRGDSQRLAGSLYGHFSGHKIAVRVRSDFNLGNTDSYYDMHSRLYVPMHNIELAGANRTFGPISDLVGVRQIHSGSLSVYFEGDYYSSKAQQRNPVDDLTGYLEFLTGLTRVLPVRLQSIPRRLSDIHFLVPMTRLSERRVYDAVRELMRSQLNSRIGEDFNRLTETVFLGEPTVAHLMYERYRLYELIAVQTNLRSPPLYLNIANWDYDSIAKNYASLQSSARQMLRPLSSLVPSGRLVTAFENFERLEVALLHQHFQLSNEAQARGLIAEDSSSTIAAYDFSADLVIDPSVQVADLTQDEPKRAFDWIRSHLPADTSILMALQSMCEFLGIPIVSYFENGQRKFFIYDRLAIQSIQGIHIRRESFENVNQTIAKIKNGDDYRRALHMVRLSEQTENDYSPAFEQENLRPVMTSILKDLAGVDFSDNPKGVEHFLKQLRKERLGVVLFNLSGRNVVPFLKALKNHGWLHSPKVLGQMELSINLTDLRELRQSGFTVDDVIAVIRLISSPESLINLALAEILPDLQSSHEFINLLQAAKENLNLSENNIQDVVRAFVSLKPAPSAYDLSRFVRTMKRSPRWLMITWDAIFKSKLVHSASQFLELSTRPDKMTALDTNRLNAFFVERIPTFLELKPNAQEIKRFQELCLSSLYDSMTLLNSALRNNELVSNPDDYNALVAIPSWSSVALRSALDELVSQSAPKHISDDWTLEHFEQLIVNGIVTNETLQIIWRRAFNLVSRSRTIQGEARAIFFTKLLGYRPRYMDSLTYQQTLTEFIQENVSYFAGLPFNSDNFLGWLRTADLPQAAAATVFTEFLVRHPELVSIQAILPKLESFPVEARLGYQQFLHENPHLVTEHLKDPRQISQLLSQVKVSREIAWSLIQDLRLADSLKVSRVFELLGTLAISSPELDLVAIFQPAFAQISVEVIRSAMEMQLPVRHQAYILTLAYYSLGEKRVEWGALIKTYLRRRPILAEEMKLIRQRGHETQNVFTRSITNSELDIWWFEPALDRCRTLLKGLRI